MDSWASIRDTYHHGDLRRALVAFALERVRSGGASEFSLREAARVCGVNASAVYKHFDDKQALLVAATAQGFVLLAERTQSSTRGKKGVERLLAIGRAYIAFASAEPHLFRLMFSRTGLADAKADCAQPSHGRSSFEQLKEALAEVTGRSPDTVDKDLLALAWSVAHGAASLICDGVWDAADPRAEAALKQFAGLASARAER